MNKLQGYGVAKVRSASIQTPENGGKTFLGVFVDFAPRTMDNGKVYTQRLSIRSYQRDMQELVKRLNSGVMITFVGEVDAFSTEKDGKHYANPRLVGRIEVLELGQQEPLQEKPRQSAKPAADAEGDFVPF
jgi:hypothetical protein